MNTIELKGNLRENIGKKEAKKLRKEDQVPCVLYGGEKNIHFSIFANDFKHLVYTPFVSLVKIDVGGKVYPAILKDKQFHPVNDKIIHADFLQIFEDKVVTISVPIKLTGSSIGIKNGGKLRQKRRTLLIKALPKDLPDHLEIDITKLDIGKTLKVGELKFENIEVLDPAQSMVISIVSPRVTAKGMEEGAEEAALHEAIVHEAETTEETAKEDSEAEA